MNIQNLPKIELEHWSKWIVDLDLFINIRPQFVFSGNIRDYFLIPIISNQQLNYRCAYFIDTLREYLKSKAYDFIFIYDIVDGLKLHYADYEDHYLVATKILKREIPREGLKIPLEKLGELLNLIVKTREAKVSVVIDYASRLMISQGNANICNTSEHDFFTACEKLSQTAITQIAGESSIYNSIIWLVNYPNDLPTWLVLNNQKIFHHSISKPNYETRYIASGLFLKTIANGLELHCKQYENTQEILARATHKMTLQEIADIVQIAKRKKIALHQILEAVTAYKLGTLSSPWKEHSLKQRIAEAEEVIQKRIKGQDLATKSTVEILKRSMMDLTDIEQKKIYSNRPKAVLFFAGPTGVGKTELAKTIAEVLFDNESSYIRFDMGRYSTEQSETKLIGSPLGYVGYESAGKLTNAIKERPFRVVLFDEIEKAHSNVLKKLLKVLEDGYLTDGQGTHVYFSETIIIFTSNLGIYTKDSITGLPRLNVSTSDTYDTMSKKINLAIEKHFKFNLNCPEFLNLLGDNIVVFDFIRENIAKQIFNEMLNNIIKKIEQKHEVEIILPDSIRLKLSQWIVNNLEQGGRSISAKLETMFVNPLASKLFELSLENKIRFHQITIRNMHEFDGKYQIVL